MRDGSSSRASSSSERLWRRQLAATGGQCAGDRQPSWSCSRGRGRDDQLARWGEVGMEEGEVLRQL